MNGTDIQLPQPPTPFGAYVEAVQTGNLLFLTGALATEGHAAKYVGRLGVEIDIETGRDAARTAALNALAIAQAQLGSLERVTRVVRLGVYLATDANFTDHAEVADGASDVFLAVFGAAKNAARMVFGVASLPLGVPVELEVILEVS